MSLIVDEMGAWSTLYPNPVGAAKGDEKFRLPAQILGIIDHGRKDPYHCFINTGYMSDSNFLISCIHRTIKRRVAENNDDWGKLPPVLHVQLDNCVRTNKNQKVFAYFASLVQTNVFR